MENASKALLIAGAVLIVIVLISIGMVIVQSSAGIAGDVDDLTAQQAIRSFNSQYENYAGSQRGASVRSLLGLVASNNASNTSDHKIFITITDNKTSAASLAKTDDPANITQAISNIVNSATYTIQISEVDQGYITGITITR